MKIVQSPSSSSPISPAPLTPHGLLPALGQDAQAAQPIPVADELTRGAMNRAMTHMFMGCVRTYQMTLRPFLGEHCRYYPSCSHYALQALREQGAWRGALLTARRLCRCHPFSAGGYDPVPSTQSFNSRAFERS